MTNTRTNGAFLIQLLTHLVNGVGAIITAALFLRAVHSFPQGVLIPLSPFVLMAVSAFLSREMATILLASVLCLVSAIVGISLYCITVVGPHEAEACLIFRIAPVLQLLIVLPAFACAAVVRLVLFFEKRKKKQSAG
ncbi:MAG: hypothetical protein HZA88_02690 [Verrucomicrobia bacterium]|nr:hypothetical protein [Verrucomicrobiota bacterium]